MILFPAIDMQGGQVVRLLHGRADAVTVYGDDPAGQARAFAAAGFSWLHLVDLDGAFSGAGANAEAVAEILKTVDLPVQLGGGIRDLARIEDWLALGVQRLVLGTLAVKNPGLVREACRLFPGRIVVGVDSKGGATGGYVAVEGWAQTTDLTSLELALRFRDAGVAALLYTDVGRDGALTGVDAAGSAALARQSGLPVIASGGVAGIEDLEALRAEREPGIEGLVVGRALYDGRLDPAAALACLAEAAC
ncbi:MAG: 1-(5-phosphoribosyl)-5-[(5-phosphoribosylamino)methylideneamino]imidazole-4-carboxamide isomerase [Rhodospirillales bacterium]|nr:1-(5-phosphoribosyl)-5-[(5-phosphoribosylamino)methylideneamino]imidazole-4-carboxamide isomerase [Rhodospirillales bacterium]